MAKEDMCDVCGGTETRLVDGFYYCAECGTQDPNIRETVIENTALGDGTFAFASRQKFSVKINDGVQMSAEWHKWHAFNFILAGLTEELLKLGARPSFKMKVLWIWAKYIKKYQNKNLMGVNAISELMDKTDDADEAAAQEDAEKKPSAAKMSRSVLVTILYLALNQDKSDIQLSHLRRYIQAGQIGVNRSEDYVPKEIETKAIPGWSGFKQSRQKFHCSLKGIATAMQQCKDLDLGPYLVPNLDSMIDNLLKELCLPNELKQLVLSLMDFAPVHFLGKNKKTNKLPDFEGLVLAYILVALKMCFGLDDDYEIRLSKAVDKINEEENYLKAYKTDMFAEKTDRLFSFREWCNYLLFRKYMLCKHNLPIARERGLFLDDYVFMEQSEDSTKKEVQLSDEVTMDIINKIPQNDNADVIPISEFEPSTTPLSTLTDVVSRHLRDIDTRILLTEDFTQYSIDYACKELALPLYSEETSENIVVGVSKSGKTFNDLLGLNLNSSYSDDTMVFVRNCENKNWFKTKRPTEDHVVKLEKASNKNIDHGYDSNIENTLEESNSTLQLRYSDEKEDETIQDVTNKDYTPIITDTSTHDLNDDDEETKDIKLELFEEEEEGKNIFDDDFLDMDNGDTKFFENDINETKDTIHIENDAHEDSKVGLQSISLIDSDVNSEPQFDPATFNREETIKQLVVAACREYKVPIPTRFRPTQEPKKRKMNVPDSEAGVSAPKRAKPDEAKKREIVEKRTQVQELLSTYYSNLEKDILHQVAQQVRSFVDDMENRNLRNDSVDEHQVNQTENTSAIEFDTNGAEIPEDIINPSEVDTHENLDKSEIDENESDDGTVQDPVYKGDPQFDEKTHDVKQLYVKVKGEFEAQDYFDLDSDEEINKLLEEQIKQSEKTVAENDSSDYDSLDDVPLAKLKKRKKHKRNREHLVENPEKINGFNYWFKHYISQMFKKHESLERFDAEVRENFSKSFAFVLFECAAVLNCSAHSLYRHVTDIEEKMLQRDGYERKKRSLKDHGIRLDRRDLRKN